MSFLDNENIEDKIVTVKDLNVRKGSDIILDNISFEINKGDFLGIIGPNGAGKTTLFKCLLGLNKDFTGTVNIFGKEIKKESKEIYKKIGYIPQSSNIDNQFPATVNEIVELGSTGKKIRKEKKKEIMDFTGISNFLDRRIGNLSGGQQQRVMIAKALINEPELLILDEPGTAIDTAILKLFYKLLTKLNKEKKITIIWSSHDLDAVNLLSNKVACIYKKLLFHGDSEEFFSDEKNIKKYTEAAMHIHIKSHYH